MSAASKTAPANPPPSGPRPEALGLAGIRGQDAVVATLRGALARDRSHHAYLFDGPEGVGKATCARALFAALNCQGRGLPVGDACGVCDSCAKLLSGNHPDLIIFDMTLSGLADEAERLVRRLGYSPHEGRAQLVLFDPADNFSAPTAATAANRLLKSLEEPIPNTYFVMVCTAAQGLLVTLRSRTQRLRFAPLPDEVMAEELQRRGEGDPDTVARVVKLAQGSLGRALREVGDTESVTRRQQAAEALRRTGDARRVRPMVELAAEIGADREEALQVLDVLWLHLHGELRGVLARPPREQAGLLSRLRLIRDAQEAIRRNTGAVLALERMLRLFAGPAGQQAGSRA